MLGLLERIVYYLCETMIYLAYIDPGSGQFLLQVIAAAAVGVLFYVKKFRDLIARLVARFFRRD